jgi:hypothetical protein
MNRESYAQDCEVPQGSLRAPARLGFHFETIRVPGENAAVSRQPLG